jgi:dTMP kinase
MFIVLEGPDCAGKSTQAKRLALTLGDSCVLTSEPDPEDSLGRFLRSRLKEPYDRKTMVLLWAAQRQQHWATVIQPALSAGKIVVCDRYVLSTFVYQTVDLWRAGTQGETAAHRTAIAALDDALAHIARVSLTPAPDWTFVLNAPADILLERIQARGGAQDVYETEHITRSVSQMYRDSVWQRVTYDTGPVVALREADRSSDPDAIASQILATLVKGTSCTS